MTRRTFSLRFRGSSPPWGTHDMRFVEGEGLCFMVRDVVSLSGHVV